MHDPNGGGFGPPGGAPPGGGFGAPSGPPQAGGFGSPPGGGFGPPGGPPQGGGFGSPPQGFGGAAPGGHAPQMQALPSVEVNTTPALILSIFTLSVCGCLPLGIPALYFADQAKKAGFRGDAAGAKTKLMISYGLSILSILCVPVIAFLYFVFLVLVGM